MEIVAARLQHVMSVSVSDAAALHRWVSVAQFAAGMDHVTEWVQNMKDFIVWAQKTNVQTENKTKITHLVDVLATPFAVNNAPVLNTDCVISIGVAVKNVAGISIHEDDRQKMRESLAKFSTLIAETIPIPNDVMTSIAKAADAILPSKSNELAIIKALEGANHLHTATVAVQNLGDNVQEIIKQDPAYASLDPIVRCRQALMTLAAEAGGLETFCPNAVAIETTAKDLLDAISKQAADDALKVVGDAVVVVGADIPRRVEGAMG